MTYSSESQARRQRKNKQMRKTMRIMVREYLAAVRTKGFVLGLVVAPLLMSGSFIAMRVFKDRVDIKDKVVGIVDHSGIVAEAVVEAAKHRNSNEIFDESNKQIRPAYVIEILEPNENDPALRFELSNRVRRGSLHAFVEIGPEVLHPCEEHEASRITYHAENAAVDDLRDWVMWPINNHLRKLRLVEAGVSDSAYSEILDFRPVDPMGLVSVDPETGEIREAERSTEARAFGIPFAALMLMFIMVLMGAMPLVNAVMEEKSQRIAEVILGSVGPFQFMMGKVLGGVGVSLTASVVYVVAGLIAVNRLGIADQIPPSLVAWFFVYMLLGLVMFGSICAALGSTCNDAKEAHSVTMPALFPVMVPMFLLVPLTMQPTSSFATWLSLIPIFTPMVMMIRIGSPATIPAWQPWVGLIGLIVVAILTVWVGSRVFRVAILMQGQPPRLADILRWAVKG
jgi:ABC-2 type transport system permease protein